MKLPPRQEWHLAVMTGSYGGTYALGRQRRLGGALGLQSGYEVAGFIVVMGWLMHSSNLSSWIPLRLGWRCLGIMVGLLAVRWIWLVALRQGQPAAITELGLNPARQPLHHLWQLCDATFSLLLGTLDGLSSLTPPLLTPTTLVELSMAEMRRLEAMVQRLEGWQTCRFAQDEPLPPLTASGSERGLQTQALTLGALRNCRELLHSPAFEQVPSVHQRQVARRLMLLEQAAEGLAAMDRRWQALQA